MSTTLANFPTWAKHWGQLQVEFLISKLDDASCSLFPDEFFSFFERLPARHCCLIGLLSIHVMTLSVITITHYHHEVLHGDSKFVDLTPIKMLQSFRCSHVQARHRVEGKALQNWIKAVWKKNGHYCKVLPWVQGKDNECEYNSFCFVFQINTVISPIPNTCPRLTFLCMPYALLDTKDARSWMWKIGCKFNARGGYLL